jgi:hypothetical protein
VPARYGSEGLTDGLHPCAPGSVIGLETNLVSIHADAIEGSS